MKILYIYDCDGWDETSNKELDESFAEVARPDEIRRLYQHRVYDTRHLECLERTDLEPITVRWLELVKGDEEDKECKSRLVAQELKRDKRQDLFAATPALAAKKLSSARL